MGLHVGALPSLSITGRHFTCISKGREQAGLTSKEVMRAIGRTGLLLRSPFERRKVNQIEDTLKYLTKKLAREGKLRAVYSAHDLRHALPFGFTGERTTCMRWRAPWDTTVSRSRRPAFEAWGWSGSG
jgi:hypothetical protein